MTTREKDGQNKQTKDESISFGLDEGSKNTIQLIKAGGTIAGDKKTRNTVMFLFGKNGIKYFDYLTSQTP